MLRVLRVLRPRLLAGDAAALAFGYACQWLGRWQWSRAHLPDGGLQNYAYAVQWMGFGVFGLGMWVLTRAQLLREAGAGRNRTRARTTKSTDAVRSAHVELPAGVRLPSYPALTRSLPPGPQLPP